MRKRIAVAVVLAIVLLGILVVRRHEAIRFVLTRAVDLATGYTLNLGDQRFGVSHAALIDVDLTSNGEPVFSARRIDIWYSLRDLLPGSRHRFGLVAVAVDHPSIAIIRHKDGSFNLRFPQATTPPPAAPQPTNRVPIRLSIRIHGGSVEVRAPDTLDPSGREMRAHGVNLDASIDSAARTHYVLKGAFVEASEEPFSAIGTIDVNRGFAMHHFRAVAVPMRSIGNFFVNSPAARILAGTATHVDARLYALDVQPDRPVNYHTSARVDVSGAAMELIGLGKPLHDIHGHLQLVDNVFFMPRLDAVLNGIPMKIEGGIFNFASPQYRIAIDGSGDLTQLRQAFVFSQTQPISGKIHLGILVEGELGSPTIAVHADGPHVAYSAIPIHDLHASVAYSNNVIYYAPLRARANSTDIAVTGTMTLLKRTHSLLMAHIETPADNLPYAGELLGDEPLVLDALMDGQDTFFHVQGALASRLGTGRAAAVLDLEPNGIVDVNPFWVHTQRGDFDARYRLDRSKNTSAFWVVARNFQLQTPRTASFMGNQLPAIPPISGRLDQLAIAGGGPSGMDAAMAGSVSAHDASISGVRIDRLAAQFAGALDGATIDSLSAAGPWGALDGRGEFSTAAFVARGNYRGTLPGLRSFLGNIPMRGTLDGPVGFEVANGHITVQAENLALHDATFHDIPVTRMGGTVVVNGDLVHVYAANMRAAGGEIVAAGTFKTTLRGKPESIALLANGLDGRQLRGLGLPLDSGRVYAQGALGNGAPLPLFNGGVVVADGSVQHFAVGGSALIDLGGDGVRLDRVLGGVDGTYALAQGQLSTLISGTPTYTMHADVPAADITRTIGALGFPTFHSTGTFNGSFDIQGRGLKPTIRGPLNVPAGSVNGLPFVDARARLIADTSGVSARRGSVLIGTTRLAFAAGVHPDRTGIHVRAPWTDLSDFNNFFDTGDTLDGNGSFRFDFISQRHRISSNGQISISQFRYRNLAIGDTRATWSSRRNVVNGALSIGGDQGRLRSSGTIALAPAADWLTIAARSHYDVMLELSNLNIAHWAAALGYPQVPLSGRAGGSATIHGSYPDLNMAGSLQLNNGTIGHLPLDEFDLSFDTRYERMNVEQATLRAPGITANASGSIGLRPNDPLNVQIHASTDDLPTFVSQLSGAPRIPVSGTFETTMQVGGTLAAPAFSAAFDAENVDAYNIKMTSLFGLARLHGRSIELRNAGVTFEHGEASLSGQLPLQLQPFGVGPSDAPLNFDVSVNDLDPSFLNDVLGNKTKLAGSINGQLGIAGTVRDPRVFGQFALTNGSYVSDLQRVPITNAVAQLTFNRTVASVDRLSARLGSGTVTGNGRILFPNGVAEGGRSYILNLNAHGAQFDLPAYGRGTIDAAISLNQTSTTDPLLAGSVNLSNATIPFASFISAAQGGGKGAPQLPIPIDFNLKLAAGKNVRVRGNGYGAGLDIGTTGSVLLTGNLQNPVLDGGFNSTGGTLTYFDRAFRVQQGEVRFNPSNGLIPTLHAVGETNVVNPDPDTARNPYGSADITINVDGPIDNLRIGFNSNPPGYSREQILALIAPLGGFVSSVQFNPATAQLTVPGTATGNTPILGAVQPVPGVLAGQTVNTISVGQEAFNILNAQFTAGLLSPFENTISQGLGLSNFNLTVDYYGNVGFSARRLLGRTVSLVYGTTFGIPTRQSFGVQLAPNETTSAQLSAFFQYGPTRLFETPVATISTNNELSLGQPLVGQSGFAFTFLRRYW